MLRSRRRSPPSRSMSFSPLVIDQPMRRRTATDPGPAPATAQELLISETSPSPSNGRTSRRRLRDAKGPLVLIGGGTTAIGPALGGFIEMTGAKDGAPIVGLTTASSQVAVAREMWLADLRQAGASNVEIPLVETRDHASDAKLAERARNARGIFLGGGDQVKLVSAFNGNPLQAAIQGADMDWA